MNNTTIVIKNKKIKSEDNCISTFYLNCLSDIVSKDEVIDCSFNFVELDFVNDFGNYGINDKQFCAGNLAFLHYVNSLKNEALLPTIFVCPFDILDNKVRNKFSKLAFIPRSIDFLDSSIWFHFVPFYKKEKNVDEKYCFETHLTAVIKNINNSNKLELYKSNVAEEELLFNIRLLKNSYIEAVGGHHKHISPFVFHSESKMSQRALETHQNIIKIIKSRNIEEKASNKAKLEWDILLVDDFAKVELNGTTNGNNINKKKIIEEIFHPADKNIKCNIEPVSSDNQNIIWKALKKLSEKNYDIILLDYLLGNLVEKENREKKGREYSHEFLNIINEICNNIDCKDKVKEFVPTNEESEIDQVINGIIKNRGPLGKFWFVNISSFQSAFLDRLREQGLGHNSEYWYLSRGGDPIHTPELFKYALFRFMELQVGFALYDKETILVFFEERFIIQSNESCELGNWARRVFGEFIHKFYSREIINHDVNNDSLFATSVFELIKKEERFREAYNLIDHFRHLLYLLAFDSGLNMQIAWEELQLIKRKLGEDKIRLEDTFKEIERYIASTLHNYN